MSVGLVMAWDQRGGLLAGAGKLIQMLTCNAFIFFHANRGLTKCEAMGLHR